MHPGVWPGLRSVQSGVSVGAVIRHVGEWVGGRPLDPGLLPPPRRSRSQVAGVCPGASSAMGGPSPCTMLAIGSHRVRENDGVIGAFWGPKAVERSTVEFLHAGSTRVCSIFLYCRRSGPISSRDFYRSHREPTAPDRPVLPPLFAGNLIGCRPGIRPPGNPAGHPCCPPGFPRWDSDGLRGGGPDGVWWLTGNAPTLSGRLHYRLAAGRRIHSAWPGSRPPQDACGRFLLCFMNWCPSGLPMERRVGAIPGGRLKWLLARRRRGAAAAELHEELPRFPGFPLAHGAGRGLPPALVVPNGIGMGFRASFVRALGSDPFYLALGRRRSQANGDRT